METSGEPLVSGAGDRQRTGCTQGQLAQALVSEPDPGRVLAEVVVDSVENARMQER